MLRCAFNIITYIRGAYDVYLCPGGIYLLIPSKKNVARGVGTCTLF